MATAIWARKVIVKMVLVLVQIARIHRSLLHAKMSNMCYKNGVVFVRSI